MAEEPEDASFGNKPEGDRGEASGISNRLLDEEIANQESLPGRLSDWPDDEVVNRSRGCTTPRRYEQPIEDDDEPCLPANRP